MPYKWKEDKQKYQREYHANWYKTNRETARSKQKARKTSIKEWFIEYKSTLKCNRCEENHPATLDFHHIDEKNEEISMMVSHGSSKKRILKEMALCEVLCSNCHRKEHYKP